MTTKHFAYCNTEKKPLSTPNESWDAARKAEFAHKFANHSTTIKTIVTSDRHLAVDEIVKGTIDDLADEIFATHISMDGEKKFIDYNVVLPTGEELRFSLLHEPNANEEIPNCSINVLGLNFSQKTFPGNFLDNMDKGRINNILEKLDKQLPQLDLAFRIDSK
ncbi:MAG: hypothetical protein ACO1N0_12160 [Fluviicola sp.]